MKSKSFAILALLAVAALALTACGSMVAQAAGSSAPQAQSGSTIDRTLSASGTGQVSISPDIAYVTIGVRTQDLDAKTAADLNASQTQDVVDALTAAGVAEEDIQTTNFNVYSFEDYSQPYEGSKAPMMYSVENSVYVKIRNLEKIGDLLGTAIESGANNIWGIQFDVSDRSEALSQAREAAVGAARAQAEELAGFAGVELGEIVTITSYGGGNPQPYAYGMGGGAAVESAASVPVTPGLMTISVDVNITFAIQ